MKVSFFHICICFFIYNCGFPQGGQLFLDSSIPVDSKNIPISNTIPYCPPKLLPKVEMKQNIINDTSIKYSPLIIPNSVDSFELKNISNFLFRMEEPLLYNIKLKKKIFRFTLLRPIHESIIIRIEKDSCFLSLFWKKSSGDGIYKPVKLYSFGVTQPTVQDWEEFTTLINSTDFWNLQKEANTLEDSPTWILEGATPNRYYITIAYIPGSEEYLFKTCMFLLKLAHINIPKNEIYE